MIYLHGLHDPGGEHLMETRPGWIVFTEAIGAEADDKSGRDYSPWSARGFGVLVRLNHGYGSAGTIPEPARYDEFAERVGNFIAASRGCTRWIIGNEPNHSQERPDGIPITPEQYIDCFRAVHRSLRVDSNAQPQLIPAPVAPWNMETGDWLAYQAEVWEGVAQIAGGIALHTYTHGHRVELVTSEARMDAPFQDRRFHFRAYLDFLARVPATMRQLPVYITETNQDEPWLDANNGWVQAAYLEVAHHNGREGTQKIHCLCLYRWPDYDRWGIVSKRGVQDGFRQAVDAGYRVPDVPPITSPTTPTLGRTTLHLPAVYGGASAPPPLPARVWDERLTVRGVKIETPALEPGRWFWRVIRGRWYSVEEAKRVGPDHHILVDMIDERGQRTPGQQLLVEWPGERSIITTEAKPGERWAANYPLSPSRHEFSIRPASNPAERVTGIGMGADLGDGFNAGHHTSTEIVWQLTQYEPAPQPSPPIPDPAPAPSVPELMHPVVEPTYRMVTQWFGERPEVYRRFRVDGVALRGHNGIDFGTPTGALICAAAAGRVLERGNDPTGYGLYIKLGHDWGETLYGHLSAQQVALDATVAAGQVIGLAGNTGFSSGPHLHFGLRAHPYDRRDGWGGYRDPAPYLGLRAGEKEPAVTLNTGEVTGLIRESATEFGAPPALYASLVWAESSYRWWAESSAGAMGLAQIMPATWEEWSAKVNARDPWNPQDNLRVGAAYLAWCIRTAGDPRRGLAAYAWGIGNVQRGSEWPETVTEYVNKVVHGADLLNAWGVFVRV